MTFHPRQFIIYPCHITRHQLINIVNNSRRSWH